MDWTKAICEAVEYIENNITEDICADDIARQVNISSFYFQKGFAMLCGYTVSEYIRNRRLSLAAQELMSGGFRVIDIAMKYCYDSPDSFAKVFSRFHGVTPSMVQKNNAIVKSFAPLKIKLSLKGGHVMDYKIVKKDAFTVIGALKEFSYENAKEDIPKFWQERYRKGNGHYVGGMFGVNIDPSMGNSRFEYLIADIYNPAAEVPDGFETRAIPAFDWAVFPCRGALPNSLQDVNVKIYFPSGCLLLMAMNLLRDTALKCTICPINIPRVRQMKIIIQKYGYL